MARSLSAWACSVLLRRRHDSNAGLFGDRRCVAAVEFAIIAPVFILLFNGVCCFGFYFMYAMQVQDLVSAATRASVPGLNSAERDTLAQNFVAQSISGNGILNSSDLTVTTATSGTPAINYSVTLNYSLANTLIPQTASLAYLQLRTIKRSSTIVFGGY